MSTALIMVASMIEIINTFTYNQYKKINYMDSNIMLLKSDSVIELDNLINKFDGRQMDYSYTYYKKAKDLGNVSYRYGDNTVSCNIKLVGVSNDFQNGYIYFNDSEYEYCSKVNVNCSTDLSNSYVNYCSIEESTSMLLFGTANSIGEEIDITVNDKEYNFIVSSVIEDRPTTVESNLEINASINKKDVVVEREIFVPIAWYNTVYENSFRSSSSVIFYLDENSIDIEKAIIESSYYGTDNIDIVDYSDLVEQLKESSTIIQSILEVILIIVFIVSGLIVMNTLFFSVKERIREIGIRRALGANKTDIITQIISEGIIYSIVAYYFTILILSIVFSLISLLCLKYIGVDFILFFKFKTYIVVLMYALMEGVVFSFLPAVYAIRMNTLSAISFT